MNKRTLSCININTLCTKIIKFYQCIWLTLPLTLIKKWSLRLLIVKIAPKYHLNSQNCIVSPNRLTFVHNVTWITTARNWPANINVSLFQKSQKYSVNAKSMKSKICNFIAVYVLKLYVSIVRFLVTIWLDKWLNTH